MSAIHVTFPATQPPRSPPHRTRSSQSFRLFSRTTSTRPGLLSKAHSAPTKFGTSSESLVYDPDADYVLLPLFHAFLRHKFPTKVITFLGDGTALIEQGNFGKSLLFLGCCSAYYQTTVHFKDDMTVCCQNTTPCGGCAGGLIGMMKNKQDFQTTSIKLHAAMVEWRAVAAKGILPKWLRASSHPLMMGDEHKEEHTP